MRAFMEDRRDCLNPSFSRSRVGESFVYLKSPKYKSDPPQLLGIYSAFSPHERSGRTCNS